MSQQEIDRCIWLMDGSPHGFHNGVCAYQRLVAQHELLN